jgi:HlyD family secretion protein
MSDINKENSESKQQSDTQPIFRDEALAYISTPNDVNKIITVVGTKVWLLILAFIIIVSMVIGWLFFGSIPITLQGQGILVPKGGIFKTMSSPEGLNIIKDLTVKTGDIVKLDQVIAVLDNPELTKMIEIRTQYIEGLKKKRDDIKNAGQKSIQEKERNKEKEKKILEDRLTSRIDYKKHLEDQLNKERMLFKKGYSKNQNILDVENQLNILKTEELQAKAQFVQLKKEFLAEQEAWEHREREIDLKLSDEMRDLENLKTRLETSSIMKSPSQGKVIGVHHKVGDKVNSNEPLVTISHGDESELEGLVYLNPLEGKEVKIGMMVYMIPTFLEKEHMGYIEGEITEVSTYPETARSLMSTLQNEELVKKFSESSPPISAKVSIKKRVTEKLPLDLHKLSPGTWIYGRVIVKRRAPIAIIIPEIKRLIGTAL